jgi:hypothetical protein
MPAGATVIRKGKQIGTTPLTLPHLAVDVSGVVELRLDGYAPTVDFALNVVEGVTTNLNAKLFSEQYVQAMKHARDALDAAQFPESRKFLTAALFRKLKRHRGQSKPMPMREHLLPCRGWISTGF